MVEEQESSLRADLQQVVREVRGLSEQLKRFPEREEVRRNYVARQESRKRIVYFILFIFISALVSYGMAITTVSVCFLSPDKEHPECSWIPGYERTVKQNDDLIEQFRRLNEITTRNERRLDRLEN